LKPIIVHLQLSLWMPRGISAPGLPLLLRVG
jgi:hypothetical protein